MLPSLTYLTCSTLYIWHSPGWSPFKDFGQNQVRPYVLVLDRCLQSYGLGLRHFEWERTRLWKLTSRKSHMDPTNDRRCRIYALPWQMAEHESYGNLHSGNFVLPIFSSDVWVCSPKNLYFVQCLSWHSSFCRTTLDGKYSYGCMVHCDATTSYKVDMGSMGIGDKW